MTKILNNQNNTPMKGMSINFEELVRCQGTGRRWSLREKLDIKYKITLKDTRDIWDNQTVC